MNDLTALKSAIFQMGLRFNQQPTTERIEAYADDLSRFTPDQVVFAFRQVINSGTAFFPSMAELLVHLKPKEISSEDLAAFVVDDVTKAAIQDGQYHPERAFQMLSEISKAFVGKNLRLLMDLAMCDIEKLPTLKAQTRGAARAFIETRKANLYNEKLESIGIDTSNVIKIEDHRNPFKALDFSEFKEGR